MQSHNWCCTRKGRKNQGSFIVRLQCSACLYAHQKYASAPRAPNESTPPTREKTSHQFEVHPYRWQREPRSRACSQSLAIQQRPAPFRSELLRPPTVELSPAQQHWHRYTATVKDTQTLTARKTDAIACQTRTGVDACEMSAPCLVGCLGLAHFVTARGAQSNRYHVIRLEMFVKMPISRVDTTVE